MKIAFSPDEARISEIEASRGAKTPIFTGEKA